MVPATKSDTVGLARESVWSPFNMGLHSTGCLFYPANTLQQQKVRHSTFGKL